MIKQRNPLDEEAVDLSVPNKASETDTDKRQVFVNQVPVLLSKELTAPIGTVWGLVGITTQELHLKPEAPIEGIDEDSIVSFSPLILQVAFEAQTIETLV